METALLTLLLLLPFVFTIFLANAGEKSPNGRAVTYLYLVLLNAGLLAFGGMFLLIGLFSLLPGWADMMAAQGGAQQVAMLRSINWGATGLLMVAGCVVGLIALLPPVRRLAARAFDIRADSLVHATALSLTATVLGANLSQTVMNRGLLNPEVIKELGQQNIGVGYADVFIFPLLILSLSALFGVGWLTRRSWESVVERLALTPPTLRQLAMGTGLALVLLGISVGADRVWAAIDPSSRDEIGGLSNALMGNFTGLAGAFAIGATAAIGEELFFRGAYQPRFGLIFTSLIFALFHTQYGLTAATGIVFVIGLVIGLARKRGAPIIICILIHFLYNFLSVVLGT